MVANLLLYVAVVTVPLVLFWLGFNWSKVSRAVLSRLRPPKPVPDGPPIERLTEDLRRIHRALGEIKPGTPVVRRRATRQAYDAVLVQTCAAVGVAHQLDQLAEGMDRDLERLRVEERLRSSGLAVP